MWGQVIIITNISLFTSVMIELGIDIKRIFRILHECSYFIELLNEFRKRDKMLVLPGILSFFFVTSLTNSIIQELE